MRFLRSILLALATLCTGLPAAWAHSSSNAYLALRADADGALRLRADVHLRDADLERDLDNDRDGQVRWAEVQARAPELLGWIGAGLQLQTAQGTCALADGDLQASERSDGHYLSAEWRIDCGGSSTQGLRLRYGLLFDRDSLHRALLKVDMPGAESSAVLSPERPEADLLPAQPPGAGAVFGHYLIEGVWHIWIGWDHILFLLSLLLLAPLMSAPAAPGRRLLAAHRAREALRPALGDVLAVVTAFTVAHSITLGLAIFEVVSLPAVLIETVIAASVVLAALNNLLGSHAFARWRLAFVFGLIHGFGFANVLLDLQLPAARLAVALAGFNIGVELGQLAIVAVFFPLAWWLRRTHFYRGGIVLGGSLAIALMGTWWILERLGLLGE